MLLLGIITVKVLPKRDKVPDIIKTEIKGVWTPIYKDRAVDKKSIKKLINKQLDQEQEDYIQDAVLDASQLHK